MEDLRRPIGPEHTDVITSDGAHQVEIAPAGSCINFMQPYGGWVECDPTAVETLTGSSGRSRSVFTQIPLTVGVRTDDDGHELVTLRLSNDPTKASELAFSLISVEDDGTPIQIALNEHAVGDQTVSKGDQVVDVVNAGTVRLLTPYRSGINSRRVVYSVSVPEGYSIVQGETWPEIHDRSGYLRSLRAVLLDDKMQPVMDTSAEMPRPLDAIALSVAADGVDESGRPRYTLTKSSKIDLSSVEWAWFDVEVGQATETWSIPAWTDTWQHLFTETSHATNPGWKAYANDFSCASTKYSWACWSSRHFPVYNTSGITQIPSGVFIRGNMHGRAVGTTAKSTTKLGIYSGTFTPSTNTPDISYWYNCGSLLTCVDIPVSTTDMLINIPLPLAAFKNHASSGKTTLCLRNEWDMDYTVATNVVNDCAGVTALNGGNTLKLILVYPHSGPSKQLCFNESMKPASGRVQFPVRINRGDTNGAAVLDGLFFKPSWLNVPNFRTDSNGESAKTLYSHCVPDKPAMISAKGTPKYVGGENIRHAVRIGFAYPDGKLELLSSQSGSNGRAYLYHRDKAGNWNDLASCNVSVDDCKEITINYNITTGAVSSNYMGNTMNITKLVTDGYNSYYIECASWAGSVDDWTNCACGVSASVEDFHFRKADGTLIPAFSRAVTKDANNAITQIDCRLSVDVVDLSGLKLCYGDPAYSDFAVDAAQITGATVAQAEANPQPGTFWDYAAIITLVVPPAAWSPLVESNPAEPFRATHSFPQVFQVEAKIFAAILIRGDFVIYKNRNNTLVWTISRKPGESAGPDLTKITKMTLSLHDLVIQSDNTAGSALRWVSETPASGPVLRVTLDLGGVTNLPLGDIPAELVLFDANNAKGWVSVQKTITIKPSVGA